MQVATFLKQVQFRLVTDIEFVAPVADANGRRVDLVTVSQMYSVEIATDLYRYRVCRTI